MTKKLPWLMRHCGGATNNSQKIKSKNSTENINFTKSCW